MCIYKNYEFDSGINAKAENVKYMIYVQKLMKTYVVSIKNDTNCNSVFSFISLGISPKFYFLIVLCWTTFARKSKFNRTNITRI